MQSFYDGKEYRHYKKMGEDAKDALLGLRQNSSEQKAAESQPPCTVCDVP